VDDDLPLEPYTRQWWADVWREMRAEFWAGVRNAMGPPPEAVPMTLGYRSVLGLVCLVGSAVLIAGLIAAPDGFFGNVVAETAGVLLGAVLAVTLIEKILSQQRREQWDAVRDEIVRAISDALLAAATSIYETTGMGYPLLEAVGEDTTLRPEIAEAMALLPDEIEAAIPAFAANLEPSLASSRVAFDAVDIEFAPVRDLATTRVVAMGNEPELVALLLRVERREKDWRSGIVLVETENAPDILAWHHAVETFRAVAALYGYLARNP